MNYWTSFFSNGHVDIEKKLRVEDFRLLRQRFNRSAADSVDISVKSDDKKPGKKNRFVAF
jgi:hypothetical protein